MPLPSHVRVGPYLWEVVTGHDALTPVTRKEGSMVYGWTLPREQRMIIAPDLGFDFERETFLHELMHCCAHLGCFAEDDLGEEEWIARTSPWLFSVLKDNPEVLEYLLEERE
jgi:hypothetical protein